MKVTREYLKQVIKEEAEKVQEVISTRPVGDMGLGELIDMAPDMLLNALKNLAGANPALAAEIMKVVKADKTPRAGLGAPVNAPQEEMEEGLKDVWAGLKTGAGKVGSDISKYGKALGTSVKTGYVSSKISTALEKTSRLAGELVAELEKLKTSSEELPVAKEFIKLIPTLKDVKKEADNARNPTPAAAPDAQVKPPPPPDDTPPPPVVPPPPPNKNLIKKRRPPSSFRQRRPGP